MQRVVSRRSVPAVVLLVGGIAAAQTWFRAGTLIAGGDNTPAGFLSPSHALDAARWVWGSSTTPTGGPDYSATLGVLPALVGRAFAAIGLGPEVAQRFFLTCLFAALAPAMFLLLRTLLPGRRELAGAFAGSFFYAFNAALFSVIPNPVLLASLVLLPLLPALIVRGSAARGWRYPLLVAATTPLLGYAFQNPPAVALVLVAALVAAVATLATRRRAAASFLLRTTSLAVPASVWWAAPTALTLFGSSGAGVTAQANPFAWLWTDQRSSLGNVLRLTPSWAWPRPEYFPYAHTLEQYWVLPLVFLPAALTFVAPLVGRGRRWTPLALAAGALVVAFLAKGLHAPLASVNAVLYRVVPGMWLFREPAAKFTLVLAALFAIGIALFTSRLPVRLRVPAAAVAVLAAAVPAYPIWLGRVVPDTRPLLPSAHVRIPGYWRAAAAYIDARPGRTLLLPADGYYQVPYRWGFYGADVIPDELIDVPLVKLLDRSSTGYLNPDPAAYRMLDELRGTIDSGRLRDAARLIDALSIRWILVRGDVDPHFPGRELQDPAQLAKALGAAPEFRFVRSFGALDLFELRRPARPMVWAAGQALTGAQPAAVEAAGGTPLVEPADGSTISSPIVGRLLAIPASSWSLQRGAVRALVPSVRGSYSLAARWPYGLPVKARLEPAGRGDEVYLDTPRILVGGQELTGGALPSVSVDQRVSLLGIDGQLVTQAGAAPARTSLTPGDHTLILYGEPQPLPLSDPSFERGTWGTVGDCNAFDARTPGEAGLSARRVRGGDGGGFALELSARVHSACVHTPLPVERMDEAYRLTLGYSRVSGSPPRLCVWETGPNRCLATPALSAAPGWHRFSVVYRPAARTTALSLYLYADGEGVERYDDVRLSGLAVATRTTVHVGADWTGIGSVDAAEELQGVEVAGLWRRGLPLSDPSFERGTWGTVGDCNAFDARTPGEAGLSARRVRGGDGGGFALELSARVHSACVHTPLPVERMDEAYRLTLGYSRVSGSPPRLCVWETGPNRCLATPALSAAPGWHRFSVVYRPAARTTALSLYLYADGEGVERYDDVRVEAVANPPDLAFVQRGGRPVAAPPAIAVEHADPGSYRVRIHGAGAPFLLSLDQTYASGWQLVGQPATHVRVNGYANGWIVDRTGSFVVTLRYTPQHVIALARLGSVVLLLVILAGAWLPGLGREVRRNWWASSRTVAAQGVAQ